MGHNANCFAKASIAKIKVLLEHIELFTGILNAMSYKQLSRCDLPEVRKSSALSLPHDAGMVSALRTLYFAGGPCLSPEACNGRNAASLWALLLTTTNGAD